jgi:hypothetical protein
MTPRKLPVLTASLIVVALACGACSESTTPADDTGDTTAPVVSATTPANGAVQVAVDATVSITFNEDMDAATATGQVTLSAGGPPTLNWRNNRTCDLTHSPGWAPGVRVTVTVGRGLKDKAGNALAAPFSFSFFTQTPALLLVATEPTGDATGVSRSADLRLQFTQTPDLTSLIDHVVISDGLTKAVYPFTATGGGGYGWATLDPAGDLPAATLITVQVGAGVHEIGAPQNLLGGTITFQFTTGVDLDATPPITGNR